MKKLQLLALSIGASFFSQAQDLSKCKNICEQTRIIETGPFLGVRFNCTPNVKNALVLEVIPNSTADKSGIKVNDIIVSFDNIEITSNPQFMKLVSSHLPGDKVNIKYLHAGETINKNIKIGALSSKEITEQVCCDELENSNPFLNNIKLSPNPTIDQVTVSSDIELKGEVQINITTIHGQLVKTIKTMNEGNLHLNINVSDIANGHYIVNIKSNNKVLSQKLVVSK